jgi:hypothetical protein
MPGAGPPSPFEFSARHKDGWSIRVSNNPLAFEHPESGFPIDLMDNLGERPLRAVQGIKEFIKGDCESVKIGADYFAGYPDGIVKLEQGEFEYDRLTLGNLPGCPDEQAAGTNVLNYIPEGALIDGVFGDDIGGAP